MSRRRNEKTKPNRNDTKNTNTYAKRSIPFIVQEGYQNSSSALHPSFKTSEMVVNGGAPPTLDAISLRWLPCLSQQPQNDIP